MINENMLNNAQSILDSMSAPVVVKRIKKDRGLIERAESEKIILAEDNRQVLLG